MPGRDLNPIRFKNGARRFQFRYHFIHDKEGPFISATLVYSRPPDFSLGDFQLLLHPGEGGELREHLLDDGVKFR